MSDRHRVYLEKCVHLEQVYLKKCLQKAQTEQNVSHAKENRMVVQGSKTQVSYIIQQIVIVSLH